MTLPGSIYTLRVSIKHTGFILLCIHVVCSRIIKEITSNNKDYNNMYFRSGFKQVRFFSECNTLFSNILNSGVKSQHKTGTSNYTPLFRI